MDVKNASTKPGARVAIQACDDGKNQQFTPRSNGEIRVYGDMCLDAAGGRSQDGDPIIIWECHGGENQEWTVTRAGEIRGANGKCIDIEGARKTKGTPLILWKCHGGENQKWDPRSAGDADKPDPDPDPAPPPSSEGEARLPREYVDTRYIAPRGETLRVPEGGDLQRALNAAKPGDQIVLQAGATYTGNFKLPKKNGSGWIVVRSSGRLPSEGTRVDPSDARSLAKLVSPDAGRALETRDGARHWRLMGLEITHAKRVTRANAIVQFDNESHHIILDRSYVHGHRDLDLRRCVMLNSASSAVIDSYVSQCHSDHYDSQAILTWNADGPLKIAGNYLEGAGETIMLGGAVPDRGVIPSDIEIRGNHFFRPTSWRDKWLVKNHLEIKTGQRVLLEGNVFENHWEDGQDGIVINLKNDQSGCGWCVTRDITFRNNRVKNVDGGIDINGVDRVVIENNVFEDLKAFGSSGRLFVLLNGPKHLRIRNNTGFGVYSIITVSKTPMEGFVMKDNIASGHYGIKGSGYGEGKSTLGKLMPGHVFKGNVLIDADPDRYPDGNFFPATKSKVGFEDYADSDYRLRSTSRYENEGTDGRDPGADIGALRDATRGVVR